VCWGTHVFILAALACITVMHPQLLQSAGEQSLVLAAAFCTGNLALCVVG